MPAKDSCHDQIVRALQKDGWNVKSKSPLIRTDDMYVFIDIDAVKNERRVFVEVKCFPGTNNSQELYIAFGQYVIYRTLLDKHLPTVTLYLAVPIEVYESIFTSSVIDAINDNHVKILIVDTEAEVIVEWIG